MSADAAPSQENSAISGAAAACQASRPLGQISRCLVDGAPCGCGKTANIQTHAEFVRELDGHLKVLEKKRHRRSHRFAPIDLLRGEAPPRPAAQREFQAAPLIERWTLTRVRTFRDLWLDLESSLARRQVMRRETAG